MKIYSFIVNEKRVSFFRKIDSILRKVGGAYYTRTLGQLKYKLRYRKVGRDNKLFMMPQSLSDICWDFEKQTEDNRNPLISIIVPCCNQAASLERRLASIYQQTYTNYEVILADGGSSDDSRRIMSAYAAKYPDKTITIINDKPVGNPLEMWKQGIQAAKGEWIWIAKGEDFCDSLFLEKIVESLCYKSVMLGFTDCVFQEEGQEAGRTAEYGRDLQNLEWDKSFVVSAHDLMENGFGTCKVIPTISCAVFKNTGRLLQEIEKAALQAVKVQEEATDLLWLAEWLFCLAVIEGGTVAYIGEKLAGMGSHPVTQEEYSSAVKVIADYMEEKKRLPKVVMACYALKSGGGETYPVYMANELKKRGMNVTLLNFDLELCEEKVKALVDKSVPVVTMKHTDYAAKILKHLGGEVVHSHHATVDYTLALWINSNPGLCKHIITLHGMYEIIAPEDCSRVINEVVKSCNHFVYISDKNLCSFQEREQYIADKFTKLANGLPEVEIHAVERKALGLKPEAFVLVLASRGIPEKGWKEAIEAVELANARGQREIHLVILGDGECKKALEKDAPEYIHFLGTVSNVRDYFAMGDAGILPSRYQGESYPLVVIECLMAGKPMIATDIGEISNQLRDEAGKKAGILIPLDSWKIDINKLANAIVELANNTSYYRELQERTISAGKRSDMDKIIEAYLTLYQEG